VKSGEDEDQQEFETEEEFERRRKLHLKKLVWNMPKRCMRTC
jgi:hypothetical protein